MKLLLTSVPAIIDERIGKPFPGIVEVLEHFVKLEAGNQVIVLSSHRDKLKLLPESLPVVWMASSSRGSNIPIDTLIQHSQEFNSRAKVFVLAANDADFHTAVNSKIMHIGAAYASTNNPDSKAYKYGMQVMTVDTLKLFIERFVTINAPWYYELAVTPNMTVYALTNANTMGNGRASETIEISNNFQRYLKAGDTRFQGVFMSYFLSSIYEIVDKAEVVDIWAIFPSSKTEINNELEKFKEIVRTSFNVKGKEPLFLRHTPSKKRNGMAAHVRMAEGCDNQLATMYINPFYEKKLAGKTVAVIDDFTTYGTSSETVRHLLTAAGVKEIIFIALGKFGNKFYKYNYDISGNVFSPNFTFRQQGQSFMVGAFNSSADNVFLNSLQGIAK